MKRRLSVIFAVLLALAVGLAITGSSAATIQHYSLWNTTTYPAAGVYTAPDSNQVELGTKFTSDTAGTVTGMRFYKRRRNGGTHVGSVWTSTGTKLASGTFTSETTTGWQTLTFSSAVPINADTTYVISYHTTKGYYAASDGYFNQPYDNAPLHAPVDAGVYAYGTGSRFPTSTYRGENYWVDPLVDIDVQPSPSPTTAASASPSASPSQSPSPTASPPPPGACAPYPAFPDASCTGPTGVMANYSGPMNITTPGAVIQNVVIHTTGITVSANNVTFRNCRIIYSGTTEADYGLVEANPVTGTVFDHCEIDGKGLVKDGIHGGDNFTVTGCNIHDVGNGVEAGWAFTVKESYLWNIISPAGYNWHADGIQSWDGTHDMVVDHNTVLMPAGEDGTVNFTGPTAQANNLVQHNLLAGGGYTVSVGSSTSNTNVQIINNHLSTRYFPKVGYYDIYYYGDGEVSGETVSGNVIDETGAPADTNI